jgi:hypothetical protein
MKRTSYWKFKIGRLTLWVYPLWWSGYQALTYSHSFGPFTWIVRPKP